MTYELPDDITKLKRELESVIPTVGSIYHWEPMQSHASVRLVVTDIVVKEDGEILVQSARAFRLGRTPTGRKSWNDLSRWVEATILIDPASEDE
jgi:hypothetical protein